MLMKTSKGMDKIMQSLAICRSLNCLKSVPFLGFNYPNLIFYCPKRMFFLMKGSCVKVT